MTSIRVGCVRINPSPGVLFDVDVFVPDGETVPAMQRLGRIPWLEYPTHLGEGKEQTWRYTARTTDGTVTIGSDSFSLRTQDGAAGAARALDEIVGQAIADRNRTS